jgi:hypothetical protein
MSDHYHKTGEDVILRNPPSFILALSDKNFTHGRDNTNVKGTGPLTLLRF